MLSAGFQVFPRTREGLLGRAGAMTLCLLQTRSWEETGDSLVNFLQSQWMSGKVASGSCVCSKRIPELNHDRSEALSRISQRSTGPLGVKLFSHSLRKEWNWSQDLKPGFEARSCGWTMKLGSFFVGYRAAG